MKMNNQADANKVINRYRNQVAEMSHELMLLSVLREQDAEEIERLTEENRNLKETNRPDANEGNSPEVIEG